jgi:hypothetical protein
MARRMIEEEEVNVLILSDRGVTQGVRPDPGAARGRRPAPLPDPRGPAHARQPRHRDRRGARGAPLRAAHRLRRERDQSLPRVRDDRRHDPRGLLPASTTRRLQELREGRLQGRHQGHVQDGHLRDPELPRRPGVRGARPPPGRRRPVLHLDASRVGGIGLDVIAQEVLLRHRAAFPTARSTAVLPPAAALPVARRGRAHLFTPESIHRLQKAVRTGSYAAFKPTRS